MVEVSTSCDFLKTLTAAATLPRAERPPAEAVVAALLQAETMAKQQRLVYPVERLLGQWQLCFATGVRKVKRGGIKLGRGFYMPAWVKGEIGFQRSSEESNSTPDLADLDLRINNQLQLGGLRFKIDGPARYQKKNILAFDFTQAHLTLLERSVYRGGFRGGATQTAAFDQKTVGKLPFFSFFLISDDFIAARGRGGGLAIWSKPCSGHRTI